MTRLRLLPISIAVAVLLLTLKVGDVWHSAGSIIGTSSATAAEGDEDKAALADEEIELLPSDDLVDRLATPDVVDVSPTEIRMLEDLLGRRTLLEAWQRDIEMRENLLAATELRIDQKIDKLKKINDEIEVVVAQFNAREDEKITSLVKIYETMKPKDAARIFNELDIEILIEVMRLMREAKAALIIAKMDSAKAKIITIKLAVRNSLPEAAETAKNANVN